jgi:hypothetical protein
MAIPTISDLAKFMADNVRIDWEQEVGYQIKDNEVMSYFAAFCDRHGVDIKIEKRG